MAELAKLWTKLPKMNFVFTDTLDVEIIILLIIYT